MGLRRTQRGLSRNCGGAHKGLEASIGGGFSRLNSLAVYGERFWLAWLASFLFFVGFYALLLPLPVRLQQLELPPWQIAIVLGAFGVGTLIARPLVGVLADTQGRRTVLVGSALVSAAATAGTAAATDALALLGLRLVHAAAYAGFTTAAVALASDLSGRARRTGALAIFATSTSLALSLTPQLMAPAVFLFGTAGALSLAALAVAMSAVPAAYAAPSHGVASASPRSSTELASGLRTLWRPFARACGLGLGFGVYLLFLPLLVEKEGYGNGAMLYAAFGVAMILTRLLTSDPLNGRWREALVVTAWTAAAAGLFAFALIPSLLGGLIASALVAFGFGVLHPAIVATHVDALPDHRHGVAVAVFYLGFDGGIGFGSWVLTPLFALVGVSSMFAAAGAISFLFGCWSLFGPEETRPDSHVSFLLNLSADPAATYGVEVVRTRVFAAAPAGGNPCPVALAADAMSSDEMRALAAHYGQDAVFMLRPRLAESAVRLRFFVPAHELALSIHATIAALTVALTRGSVRASPLLVETELGLVRAEWHETGFGVIVAADQWEPDFGPVVSEPDIVRLAEMLRIRRADIDDRTTPVQSASVSRAKLIVPLHDTATLHALDPDLERIWRACEGWRTTGVYVFARSPEPRLHVEARQYPLRAGFVEDPATGVAAGALAAYLVAHAVFGPQREGVHEFAIGQGRAMGRPSEITARCWVESGRITRTQVAGHADIDGTETYSATRIAAGGPQRTLGG